MGCSTCGRSSTRLARTVTPTIQTTLSIQVNSECPYTMEQVDLWLDKVNCIRTQGLYTQIPNITTRQINSYVSYLLSAKNYASKPCYFEKELEEIESFITVITALNLCNNN